MVCHLRSLLILTACLSVCVCSSAESYTIKASELNAMVTFSISFPVYGRIEGRFERLRGKIDLDEDNPSRSQIKMEIDTTSVNSGFAARDNYLRGPTLLSAKQHPTALFRSSMIRAANPTTLVIWGDLTLRGVTRRIAVVARLRKGGRDTRRRQFQGATSFRLSAFGINSLPTLFATKLHLVMQVDEKRR